MSGYEIILQIKRIEAKCNELGFLITKVRDYNNGFGFGDLAIIPKDNQSLPPYSRDAEIFVGTVNELERWLEGIEWARKYDRMLFGVKHDEKRVRKEQDFRNEVLVKILKSEKVDSK